MNIAILTLGTRGDIQPYAILGKALKARGHHVTLSTGKNFKSLIQKYGLEFVPLDVDFQALLNTDEGKELLKGNPLMIRKKLHTLIYPMISDSLNTFYELAEESDIVLYHVKTLADSFADQFPNKMIRASVLPIVESTREFANPSFSGFPIPKLFNELTYTLSNMSIKLLRKPISDFRTNNGLSKGFNVPYVKNIYSMSPSFLPTPLEYKDTSKFSGFWLEKSHDYLPIDVEKFIKKSGKPLVITFGSMPYNSKLDLKRAILDIVEQLQTSVILIKAWGLNETFSIQDHPNILLIERISYSALFPYVKAVVHHGGIGTTAECLRAGVPFMICPILYPMGDQMFWGKIAFEKGIAVKPKALSKISNEEFLKKISKLLKEQILYKNAQVLKKKIDQENGIDKAIQIIEIIYQENIKCQQY